MSDHTADHHREFDEELAAAVEPAGDDGQPVVSSGAGGRFTIDSLDKADWALRKLRVRRARLEEARAYAKRAKRRIAEWIAEEEARCERDCRTLVDHLEAYLRARRETDPDLKTLFLPSGELWARPGQDQWTYDEATFVAWAVENEREELIRREPKPAKKAVRKALVPAAHDTPEDDDVAPVPVPAVDPATGETVPGVWITPATVSYTARPYPDDGEDG